ncbi:MAG: tol-pal system-associated acyl-CoA thioesterase [Gammaproteobacteria bacterium]|jgi:acyl-CoA thioester hydrolase|nr:tol-pal system-associated acyl-CoA thioesterase [Gammaproteobacteria bacterium]
MAHTRTTAGDADWHVWPVRVYYEDTDAQGIVYFANYLRFMERGRTEWLRERGVSQAALAQERQLCFSLISTDVRFIQPAVFDDELNVKTRVIAVTGARVRFEQAVSRRGTDQLLCTAECVAACLDTVTLRPRRLPAAVFSAAD